MFMKNESNTSPSISAVRGWNCCENGDWKFIGLSHGRWSFHANSRKLSSSSHANDSGGEVSQTFPPKAPTTKGTGKLDQAFWKFARWICPYFGVWPKHPWASKGHENKGSRIEGYVQQFKWFAWFRNPRGPRMHFASYMVSFYTQCVLSFWYFYLWVPRSG